MGINCYLNAQVPNGCILILDGALTCYLMGRGLTDCPPGIKVNKWMYIVLQIHQLYEEEVNFWRLLVNLYVLWAVHNLVNDTRVDLTNGNQMLQKYKKEQESRAFSKALE